MQKLILSLAALAALVPAASANPGHEHAAKTAPKKGAALVCPVTGDKIASAAKAFNKETYKGKTYYFCCPECKPRFDKNRDGIVKNAAKGKYEKM